MAASSRQTVLKINSRPSSSSGTFIPDNGRINAILKNYCLSVMPSVCPSVCLSSTTQKLRMHVDEIRKNDSTRHWENILNSEPPHPWGMTLRGLILYPCLRSANHGYYGSYRTHKIKFSHFSTKKAEFPQLYCDKFSSHLNHRNDIN